MNLLLLLSLLVTSVMFIGSSDFSYAETPSVDVDEGSKIALIGQGSDPDNDTLTYQWEQISGEPVVLSALDVAEPYFVAPSVNNGEIKTLEFRLTVSDPFGGSSQESITLDVHPINHSPTVDAGRDKLLLPSVHAITLFANAHDSDGDLLSFTWKQLGGQNIYFSDLNKKHLTLDSSFLDFNNFETITFEVTVDDGFGGTDSDIVDVYIGAFGADSSTIRVNAGPIQTVNEGSQVTLFGEGSEVNNKPITFSWLQSSGQMVNLSSTVSTQPTFTAPTIDDEQPITLSFILTGYASGSGYGQDMAIVKVLPVNNAPIVDAGQDVPVRELSAVKIIGSASDPDGDRVTLKWTQISGPEIRYDQFFNELSFVAPNVQTGQTSDLEFELVGRDSQGLTSSDTVIVSVGSTNHPPSAHAGPDKSVTGGTFVTIFGSGFDSDGDPLTYSWTQISGPNVNLEQDESIIKFTSPDGIVNRSLVMTFELTVSDSFGGAATDYVNISILPPNNSPIANAGLDTDVNENNLVTLNCIGSDRDGDPLTYSWTQISGMAVSISNTNSPTISFLAPSVVDLSTLEFECTVSDGHLSSSDSVKVSVFNILSGNIIADAGDDRIVNENRLLSLNGSGSYDEENQSLTYSWTQTSGESVDLSDTSATNPTFKSPSVVNGQIKVLLFELTVFDDNGRSDKDTVTITVDPVNAPPEVTVKAKQLE